MAKKSKAIVWVVEYICSCPAHLGKPLHVAMADTKTGANILLNKHLELVGEYRRFTYRVSKYVRERV